MFYVYSENIDSGRQDFCKMFNTKKEAQAHIRLCINTDEFACAKDEYYYFIKER